nr:vegetative cell wall protein gp1-like [Penaeus vannamei]
MTDSPTPSPPQGSFPARRPRLPRAASQPDPRRLSPGSFPARRPRLPRAASFPAAQQGSSQPDASPPRSSRLPQPDALASPGQLPSPTPSPPQGSSPARASPASQPDALASPGQLQPRRPRLFPQPDALASPGPPAHPRPMATQLPPQLSLPRQLPSRRASPQGQLPSPTSPPQGTSPSPHDASPGQAHPSFPARRPRLPRAASQPDALASPGQLPGESASFASKRAAEGAEGPRLRARTLPHSTFRLFVREEASFGAGIFSYCC